MFIKQSCLKFTNVHGEILSADHSSVEPFLNKFYILASSYNQSDIINFDETSLYIKGVQNRSYVAPDDQKQGTKLDKSRITLLLGVSATGEKFPPLIIGKSARPRALKNVDLSQFNLKYTANKKGWMTTTILKDYGYDLNNEMIKQNRKILLVLDNFSGHNINDLFNIVLVFLPPNTTTVLQPLDQVIISVFKQKYRSKLCNFLVFTYDDKNQNAGESLKNVNLLTGFNWVDQIISDISTTTIKNCWIKSRLIKNDKPIV